MVGWTRYGSREMAALQWGLVPRWSKERKTPYSTINARAETVAAQAAFRDAFKKRRCIIPASGFYEWTKTVEAGKEIKQPHHIRRPGNDALGFAGPWERWAGQNEALESFTIITTTANKPMRALHHRMPAILDADHYAA